MRIYLGLLLLMVAATAQAGSNSNSNSIMAPANSLPAETITAIQRISHNVLQAKRQGRLQTDNGSDQVSQLNSVLNQLIAVEQQASQTNAINLPGNSATTPVTQTSNGLIARMLAHNQAWDAVSALRLQAEQLQGQNNTPPQVKIYSGGFSIGEQRGRLFDKWADELEAILDNNTSDRLPQLTAFKARLQPQSTIANLNDNLPKTPTLQVMPQQRKLTLIPASKP
ncbi:MAG: hypothetical protein ABSB19_09670 [Methylomonas sp.]|jgi:hypothetical protein